MGHSNKGRLKKLLERWFILIGTVALIAMAIIVALNFSRDSRLFAGNSVALPKPINKPVTTQSHVDGQKEKYGTLTYERQGFEPGESSDDSDGVSKKLKDARIEIINCSGKDKLGEELKTVLMDIGINSVTVIASAKNGDTEGETSGNQVNEHSPQVTTQTSPTEKSSENTPLPTPKVLKATPAAKSGSISRAADRETPRIKPKITPVPTLKLTSTYTPVAANTSEIFTATPGNQGETLVTPDKGNNAANRTDNVTDSNVRNNASNSIIRNTLIIERNSKGLGSEIKKIIKAGKIIKEEVSGYGYDITIKIGSDYIPK